MNQTFAKIVLMVTGIIMLALSVLPHHHHSGCGSNLICFSLSVTGEADHEHNPASNHSHDESDCDIRNIFVMSGRDDNSNSYCAVCDNDNIHPLNIHALLAYVLLPEQFSHRVFADNRTILYDIYSAEPLRSEYSLSVRTLRAPPVFIA